MIRKLQNEPNVVLATIPQTGHLAKRKTAQVADAACVRLLYTCTVQDEGEAGDGAGRNLDGWAWSGEEWEMAQYVNEKSVSLAGEPASRRMARTGRIILYRLGAIVEICILIGVIVLFNAFPEKVGYYSSAVEPYLFVPLLTSAWMPFVPWLNVWWSLALMLALVKLVYGRWTQVLRLADMCMHLLSITVVAGVLLAGGITGAWGDSAVSVWSWLRPDLLTAGFKAVLALVLVALIVSFFSKLAKHGIAIPVLQWRPDGGGPRVRWIRFFSPSALRLGAVQGKELLKDARSPHDAQ